MVHTLMHLVSVNILVHVFLWTFVLFHFGCILRSRIAGSCNKIMFSFSAYCETLFQSTVVIPVNTFTNHL